MPLPNLSSNAIASLNRGRGRKHDKARNIESKSDHGESFDELSTIVFWGIVTVHI